MYIVGQESSAEEPVRPKPAPPGNHLAKYVLIPPQI